jgi:hypothetical protein
MEGMYNRYNSEEIIYNQAGPEMYKEKRTIKKRRKNRDADVYTLNKTTRRENEKRAGIAEGSIGCLV